MPNRPELEGRHGERDAAREQERPAGQIARAELGLGHEALGLGDAGLLALADAELQLIGHGTSPDRS